MQITKTCPFCGNVSNLFVKDEQWEKYERGTSAPQAFNDIDDFGRELIISGICFSCQEKTFNKPLKFHEEEWGELLGDCMNCGCSIYKNHNKCKKEPDKYECPSCMTKMRYINPSTVNSEEEESGLVEDDYE